MYICGQLRCERYQFDRCSQRSYEFIEERQGVNDINLTGVHNATRGEIKAQKM